MASSSGSGGCGVLTRFVPTSGWTTGAPSAMAASSVATAGVGSMSTSTRSTPSSATYRLVATTTATGSPTNRTSSAASGTNGGPCCGGPIDVLQSGPDPALM